MEAITNPANIRPSLINSKKCYCVKPE